MADWGAEDRTLLTRTTEFLPADETDLFFVTPRITRVTSVAASLVLAGLVCAILSLI